MHFPKCLKTSRITIYAEHHLKGFSKHTDAEQRHGHNWDITLAWKSEYSPLRGFTRDEPDLELYADRVRELDGAFLPDLLNPHPSTAENLALFLLHLWVPRLSPHKLIHDLHSVTVSKCDQYTATVYASTASYKWATDMWGNP